MIENLAKATHAEMWTQTFRPCVELGCQVADTGATGTIVLHALTIANPKTNTLHYFTFESPEAGWDDA